VAISIPAIGWKGEHVLELWERKGEPGVRAVVQFTYGPPIHGPLRPRWCGADDLGIRREPGVLCTRIHSNL